MVGFEKIMTADETEHGKGSWCTMPRSLPFIVKVVGVARDFTHTLDNVSQFAFRIRLVYEKNDSKRFLICFFFELPGGSSPISA